MQEAYTTNGKSADGSGTRALHLSLLLCLQSLSHLMQWNSALLGLWCFLPLPSAIFYDTIAMRRLYRDGELKAYFFLGRTLHTFLLLPCLMQGWSALSISFCSNSNVR